MAKTMTPHARPVNARTALLSEAITPEEMRAEFVNLLRWRLKRHLNYRTTHALQIVNTASHRHAHLRNGLRPRRSHHGARLRVSLVNLGGESPDERFVVGEALVGMLEPGGQFIRQVEGLGRASPETTVSSPCPCSVRG